MERFFSNAFHYKLIGALLEEGYVIAEPLNKNVYCCVDVKGFANPKGDIRLLYTLLMYTYKELSKHMHIVRFELLPGEPLRNKNSITLHFSAIPKLE